MAHIYVETHLRWCSYCNKKKDPLCLERFKHLAASTTEGCWCFLTQSWEDAGVLTPSPFKGKLGAHVFKTTGFSLPDVVSSHSRKQYHVFVNS